MRDTAGDQEVSWKEPGPGGLRDNKGDWEATDRFYAEQGDDRVCALERKGVCRMGWRARWKQGAKVGPGRMWCDLNKGRWKDVGAAEMSLDAGPSQRPAHLHAELPNFQLQLPHLGLPLSHHGAQLGDEAAALLSLVVELLSQVVLGGSCLLLLKTQASQDLLELLQLVLGVPRRRAGGQPQPLGKEGQGKTAPATSTPPFPVPAETSQWDTGVPLKSRRNSFLFACWEVHQAGGSHALFLPSTSFSLRSGPKRTSKGLSG